MMHLYFNQQFREAAMADSLAFQRYGKQLFVGESGGVQHRSSQAYTESSFISNPDSDSLDDVIYRSYRTGIRGGKKYLLYLVILLLFLVALANILTTFALMGVLRLGYGMEGMEFIPDGVLIRFLQSVSIDVVIPTTGIVGGFKGESFSIIGNDQPVILQTKHGDPTSVAVSPQETSVTNVNSFKVINPTNGHVIFSTDYGEFRLPNDVNKVNVRKVTINKITSPVNRSLSLDSDAQVRMRGNEGLHMIGLNLEITAGEDVYLKSRNGSIILDAMSGVLLHVNKLPRVADSEDSYSIGDHQYKICVCMPSGKLFRIYLEHPDYNCENVNATDPTFPCG